jgi:hypothetical protein
MWPTQILLAFQDFTVHDFTILVAKFTGFQSTKTQYRNPCVNPMALVAWIYGPTPPELRTFRNTRGKSLALREI